MRGGAVRKGTGGWTKAGSPATMTLTRESSTKEPAMPFSYLPPLLTSVFASLARWLDKRTAARLPLLLAGVLLARGCRTVTSWFRAAGITDDFRQSYVAVCAVGREADHMALSVVTDVVRPLLKSK